MIPKIPHASEQLSPQSPARDSCVLQLEKAYTTQQRPRIAKERNREIEGLTPALKNVNLFGNGGIIVAISYDEVILK